MSAPTRQARPDAPTRAPERGIDRRAFVRTGLLTGAGLWIGLALGSRAKAAPLAAAPGTFAPNAFVRLSSDGRVTFFSPFIELGQGVLTSLAMCIAEELDADWDQVAVEHATGDAAFAHPWFGFQMTGGSSSTSTSYRAMREAGAFARALLVRAAAARWSIDAGELRTERGVVLAPDGRRLGYGELVADAARLPAPEHVALKDPREFRILGRSHHRVDAPERITGRTRFSIDLALPGLLTAVLVRPPEHGARLKTFDASATRAIAGVRRVALVGPGVAVLAADFWSARLGAEALRVTWHPGPLGAWNSDTQRQDFVSRLAEPGVIASETGDVAGAFAAAATRIEADFDFPYLAHACMEPVNAVADVRADSSVEVWAPTQVPDADRAAAARVAGVPLERVTVHVTPAGGSFGRKSGEDFVPLAVEASRIAGAPVKLVWTREDDMRAGYYRPRTLVRVRLGLDAAGQPASWETQVVSPSIIKNTTFGPTLFKDGLDRTQTGSFEHLSYPVPHQRHRWHAVPDGIPVLAWRDPGPIVAAFAIETLIDEAAHAAGRDPFDYRLALVCDQPRAVAVLTALREHARWGAPPPGRVQGLAIKVGGSGTQVGEVAELSIGPGGEIRVHRVTVVVDCGFAVNPDGVRAQMMGSVIQGLSAALHEAITVQDGRVVQGNFHDYPILRMPEAPEVDVHLVPGDAPPSGVGEPGIPLIAPAVANAVFAATGRRLRTLPLRLG